MYSTCIFCHESLGSSGILEAFPIGRRLAFDAQRGRLWVICPRCQRWSGGRAMVRFRAPIAQVIRPDRGGGSVAVRQRHLSTAELARETHKGVAGWRLRIQTERGMG